eukprot:jgi/Undpi1/2172/HiC_scaffold_12.g05558.m1
MGDRRFLHISRSICIRESGKQEFPPNPPFAPRRVVRQRSLQDYTAGINPRPRKHPTMMNPGVPATARATRAAATTTVRAFRRRTLSSSSSSSRKPVFVDGARIPFVMSGTAYKDLLAVDLGKLAMRGLLNRNPELDPKDIDYVLFGTVIQARHMRYIKREMHDTLRTTSNIAREAGMGAGIPVSVPSHTVAQACISANQALCGGAEKILAGTADIVLAGGTETFSDLPIRFSRPIRCLGRGSRR